MHILLTMGERISDLIKESGKNLEEISNEITTLHYPISKATLSDMTNSDKIEKNFGYKYIAAVAKYFKVSTDYLIGLTDVKTTDKDLQYICNYTGLTEKNVEKLHSLTYAGELERKNKLYEESRKAIGIDDDLTGDEISMVKGSAKKKSRENAECFNDLLDSEFFDVYLMCYQRCVTAKYEILALLGYVFEDKFMMELVDKDTIYGYFGDLDGEEPLFMQHYHLDLWDAIEEFNDYIKYKAGILEDLSKQQFVNVQKVIKIAKKVIYAMCNDGVEYEDGAIYKEFCKEFGDQNILLIKKIYENEIEHITYGDL